MTPATIQEDLRGRDFTCNAIALSLNKASRGLLLDPMNGLADIERQELRAISAYGFYDDPSRLLRLVRFRVRLGFTVEERTQMQVANAREAEVEKLIPRAALAEELKRIGAEDSPAEILKALEEAGPAGAVLAGAGGPQAEPGRAGEVREGDPACCRWTPPSRAARWGPFLYALTEKLTAKEEAGADQEPGNAQGGSGRVAEAGSARQEAGDGAARGAHQEGLAGVPHHVRGGAGRSPVPALPFDAKPVQERLRNYFQKYLPALQEITPEEWATVEGKPGTPKHNKAREDSSPTGWTGSRRNHRSRSKERCPAPAPATEVAARRAK